MAYLKEDKGTYLIEYYVQGKRIRKKYSSYDQAKAAIEATGKEYEDRTRPKKAEIKSTFSQGDKLFSVQLPRELIKELKVHSANTGQTMRDFVRIALKKAVSAKK